MEKQKLDPAMEINPRDAKYIVKELLLLIPNLIMLLGRLIKDKRIPRRYKTMLGMVIAYIVIPTDLVSDFIPFLGQIDDLYLVALALNGIMSEDGQKIIEEHWNGDRNILLLVQNILSTTVSFVPKKVRDRLYKIIEFKG